MSSYYFDMENPMNNYDYYRIFYYVAKYQSFTKAAELLNNSQPNLTRYMNNLEHSLDCIIYLRTYVS